jgi:hypothetical protein
MKLHVLTGHANVYDVVVHGATPAGQNSAGLNWSTVLVAALAPKSTLTVGSGPGQTTQTEVDAVAAGTLLEVILQFYDDPAMTPTQRNVALDALAAQALADYTASLADILKWYGATRA